MWQDPRDVIVATFGAGGSNASVVIVDVNDGPIGDVEIDRGRFAPIATKRDVEEALHGDEIRHVGHEVHVGVVGNDAKVAFVVDAPGVHVVVAAKVLQAECGCGTRGGVGDRSEAGEIGGPNDGAFDGDKLHKQCPIQRSCHFGTLSQGRTENGQKKKEKKTLGLR